MRRRTENLNNIVLARALWARGFVFLPEYTRVYLDLYEKIGAVGTPVGPINQARMLRVLDRFLEDWNGWTRPRGHWRASELVILTGQIGGVVAVETWGEFSTAIRDAVFPPTPAVVGRCHFYRGRLEYPLTKAYGSKRPDSPSLQMYGERGRVTVNAERDLEQVLTWPNVSELPEFKHQWLWEVC
jgi:hypothetical protein